MTNTPVRHLVLDIPDSTLYAIIACTPNKVLFDERQHTILTARTTCPSCLAVHAARSVLIAAEFA